MRRDLVRADARAGELDHRPAEVLVQPFLLGDAHGQLAEPAQLLGEADEWMHDLDERCLPGPPLHGNRRADDRAHLHLVDLGPEQPEPAAARTEHRIRLLECLDPLAHRLVGRVLQRGQEFVQRRVEQPDRHGQPGHGFEDPFEVGLLHRQQLVEGLAPLVLA